MGGAYLSFSFVGNAHIAPRISDSPSPQRHKRRHPQTESRSATGRLQRLNTGLPGPFPIYGVGYLGGPSNRPPALPNQDIPVFAKLFSRFLKEAALICPSRTTPACACRQ